MATPYPRGSGDPTAKVIERTVANFFGIRVVQFHRKRTIRAVALPLRIAMYLMKQMTDASTREIGQYFNDEYPSHVERSIATLEEQRYKKDLLDLVIRDLRGHAEMRLKRERRRIRQGHRRTT
jgi:chromosomal replication initiator protein